MGSLMTIYICISWTWASSLAQIPDLSLLVLRMIHWASSPTALDSEYLWTTLQLEREPASYDNMLLVLWEEVSEVLLAIICINHKNRSLFRESFYLPPYASTNSLSFTYMLFCCIKVTGYPSKLDVIINCIVIFSYVICVREITSWRLFTKDLC